LPINYCHLLHIGQARAEAVPSQELARRAPFCIMCLTTRNRCLKDIRTERPNAKRLHRKKWTTHIPKRILCLVAWGKEICSWTSIWFLIFGLVERRRKGL